MQKKGPNRDLRNRQNERQENLKYTYTLICAGVGLAAGALVGYFLMDNIVSGLMIFCGLGIVVGSMIDFAIHKKNKNSETK